MAASDEQMQQYCDQRIRVRAEELRASVNSLRDDKASIDEAYARASGGAAWADSRTDGPPKLLSGADVLNYNTVITALLACIDGTATLQDVTDLHGNWAAFQSTCVRPVGQ